MNNNLPLTLPEEFLLLAFDPKTGKLFPLDPPALKRAVAAAVLMELTLRNRIDNDLKDMFTVDPTPTGDEVLDPILRLMAMSPVLTPHPISYWLDEIADQSEAVTMRSINRLEKSGIIKRPLPGLFWMFGAQKSTTVDDQSLRNAKAHLLGVIYGSDVPSARDTMLTGLANATGLFHFILNETEVRDFETRIAMVARMDLIAQAITQGLSEPPSPPLAVASGNR